MDPDSLARAVRNFLADAGPAIVLEDGALIFDFAHARYSLSTDHGKCVLHLWSAERNAVRRVLDAELKNGALRLSVLRFGQSKPLRLEICRDRDRRSPSQRKVARANYQQRLRAIIERNFPGWAIERLTAETDLGRSFSPVYTRGQMRRAGSAFAVLGVNAQESQSAIDGALTFAILWLDHCRARGSQRTRLSCAGAVERGVRGSTALVEGLKLFVPRGAAAVVRERMAHLDHAAAKWQLYELDEREGTLAELDCADRGNIQTRLVQCPDQDAARGRFAGSIRRITDAVPAAELVVLSAGEIAFRLHGLEFARARLEPEPGTFRLREQIVFGAGPNETILDDTMAAQFAELVATLGEIRQPRGPRTHPLWRATPERWLESIIINDVRALDERLDPTFVYSQVPAFAARDRAMIDVLTVTRSGQLAVLELKADEDIHLPLQGVDYWGRVEWHRARGEFQRFGYFPSRTTAPYPHAAPEQSEGEALGWGFSLAPEPPLLLLVAPALHVHPATDTLLRYLSPEIDCTLLGIDEHWRDQLRVIFRKRARELNH